MNFIPRKYKLLKPESDSEFISNDKVFSFDDIIRENKIAVILGEPASGKSFQFKQYEYDTFTRVIELITIEDIEPIDSGIRLVLIDSIDEARVKYDDKRLKLKLKNFIKKSCFDINQDIKIVISCRYNEWKEIFSDVLKSLDSKLTVYNIKELDKNDIEKILKQKDILVDEFWIFVEKNYLNELLKNIMLTIHIIENFESYKIKKEVKYQEIYIDIINKNLAPNTENENNKNLKNILMPKRLKIASSLAIYMTLEEKRYDISVENMDILSGELYNLNGVEITPKELELIIANTSLFVGVKSKKEFFHKSIQEFLTAYFINEKKLDFKTIKQLFSHEIRFYDRYEEVIIYLTNLQPKYFRRLVLYDPFIFRRHPYLDKKEQELLLHSIINTLKGERQKLWGKWDYIYDSTLLLFRDIDDICEIITSEVDVEDVNYELFSYLIQIFESKYSKELENFIFEILEYQRDKELKYMYNNYINNISYNKRLLEFIVRYSLFDENHHSFYNHIFRVLYQKLDFKEIKILLKYFSYGYKNTVLDLNMSDLLMLSNDIDENFTSEQVSIIVFALLKNYQKIKLQKEDLFLFITLLIEKNHSMLRFHISDYEVGLYRLDFNTFKEDFCKLFFRGDGYKSYSYVYSLILYYCDIQIMDTESIIKIYPISIFPKKYQVFHRFEDIKELLIQNNQYSNLLKQEEKERKEQELFYKKENQKYEWYQEEIEKEKRYKDAINLFSKTKDFRTVFFLSAKRHDNINGINNKLKEDLGNKYQEFIEIIKDAFREDILYRNYKIGAKYHDDSIIYNFLYAVISDKEIKELILDEYQYEKLFWHLLILDGNNNGLSGDKFIELSKDYIPTLIVQYQNLIEKGLKNENHPSDRGISRLKYMLIEIDKFNFETLKDLVIQITKLYEQYYQKLTYFQKSDLLDFICLDKKNYDFIKSIMICDKDNEDIYLKHLFLIDLNKAVNEFYTYFFPEIIVYKVVTYQLFAPTYKYDIENDNCHINPIKLKAMKRLFSLLWTEGLKSSILSDDIFYNLFIRYYDYFKEVKYLSYNKMDDLVSVYWEHFGETPDRLELLKKLSMYPNKRLQAKAKYVIEQVYNDNPQLYINYKEILDSFNPEDNNRFFDYEKLTYDLEDIALRLTDSRKSIIVENENLINDRFRDALKFKDYNVADQSRGGESESSKGVGSRDIVIENRESKITETVLEGMIFNNKTETVKHYKKLIKKYDTVGNAKNYMLVYVKKDDFDSSWMKYQKWFDNFKVLGNKKENVKLGMTSFNKMKIIHIFVNFYSSNTDINN